MRPTLTAQVPRGSTFHASAATNRVLPGSLVVCFLLATTRWGSHLNVSFVYVTDVLVAGALLRLVVQRGRRTRFAGLPILWVALAWIAVRLATSLVYSMETLRDVAPHFYLVAALLSTGGARVHSAASRARTADWLLLALRLHLFWVLAALLVPSISDVFRVSNSPIVHVFQMRPDVDAALVGVLGVWQLRRLLSGEATRSTAPEAAAAIATVLSISARAGLLAMLACGVLAFAVGRQRLQGVRRRKMTVTGFLPIMVSVGILVVPLTDPGARLLSSFGTANDVGGASGTTRARWEAWDRTVDFISDEPFRLLFGVGYGTDVVHASSAGDYLGDYEPGEVRSPHNFAVSLFARLGLVGVVLGVLLAATVVGAAGSQLRRGLDALSELCLYLLAALGVTSLVGVVLESPFGAIPFYWSLGVVLASSSPRRPRRTRAPSVAHRMAGPGSAVGSSRGVGGNSPSEHGSSSRIK